MARFALVPISMISDDGSFHAEILPDDWAITGRPAVVRRRDHSWDVTVQGFGRATLCVLERHLKSGERRSAPLRVDLGLVLGGTMPIRYAGYDGVGTIVESTPATRVTIRYRIQSGDVRTRKFYADEAIGAYWRPQSDGSVALIRLNES